jgi:hypothetical protein
MIPVLIAGQEYRPPHETSVHNDPSMVSMTDPSDLREAYML